MTNQDSGKVTPPCQSPTATVSSQAKTTRKPPSLHKPQAVMITVIVGPEQEKFSIHKDFLTYNSPYFAKALHGQFSEATEKKVELDHTTVTAFGLFQLWIYKKDLKESCTNDSLPSAEDLADLWILADYLQMPGLQNKAIDLLVQQREKVQKVATNHIIKIWEQTRSEAPLRTLFVDFCAWRLDRGWWEKYPSQFPHEMLISLCTALHKKASGQKPPCPLMCSSNYHVKTDTQLEREAGWSPSWGIK